MSSTWCMFFPFILSLTYYLHGHLVWLGAGRQQLLGDRFPLSQAGGGQDGPPAVLVDHHGGPRVDLGPVEDGLPQLLHVPGRDGLRVRQLGGKHLVQRKKDEMTPSSTSAQPMNVNEWRLPWGSRSRWSRCTCPGR